MATSSKQVNSNPSKAAQLKPKAPAIDMRCAEILLDIIPSLTQEFRQYIGTKSELTFPQFRVLSCIQSKGMKTGREMADWIGVSLPAISRMVDLLVHRGFIERLPSGLDRRQTPLRLTPKGRRYHLALESGVRKALTQRMSHIDISKKSFLLEALEVLRQSLIQSEDHHDSRTTSPARTRPSTRHSSLRMRT